MKTIETLLGNCYYVPKLKNFEKYLDELDSIILDLEKIYKKSMKLSPLNKLKGKHRTGFNDWTPKTIDDVTKLLKVHDKNTSYKLLEPNFEKEIRDTLSAERNWGNILLGNFAQYVFKQIERELPLEETEFTEENWAGRIEPMNKENTEIEFLEYRIKRSIGEKILYARTENKEIYDSNGFRIVMKTEEQCYKVAEWLKTEGIINYNSLEEDSQLDLEAFSSEKIWDFSGRFKDYIKNRKPGLVSGEEKKGYSALSLTVSWPAFKENVKNYNPVAVEIQILTKEMYDYNMNNPEAKHSDYKIVEKEKTLQKYPPFAINMMKRLFRLKN